MRKLIVSIHSTANGIVTGPPSDETNFMVWAQAGIEDSLEPFLESLANVDTVLLGARHLRGPGEKVAEGQRVA